MEPYVVVLALVVVLPRPRAQFDARAYRSVQLRNRHAVECRRICGSSVLTPSRQGQGQGPE